MQCLIESYLNLNLIESTRCQSIQIVEWLEKRIKNNLMNGRILDLSSKCFDPIMNKYFIADDSTLTSTCYIKTIRNPTAFLWLSIILTFFTMSIWLPSLFLHLEQAGEGEQSLNSVATELVSMLVSILEKAGVLVMCFSSNISMALAKVFVSIWASVLFCF